MINSIELKEQGKIMFCCHKIKEPFQSKRFDFKHFQSKHIVFITL